MRNPLTATVLVALALAGGGAAAQAPAGAQSAAAGVAPGQAGRGPWLALEDSLESIREPRALPPSAVPPRAAPPAAWLRRGLVLLRRYELRHHKADYDSSREALEQAARRDPADAFAAYALGRALLQSPELDPQPGQLIVLATVRRALGRDPHTKGVEALRKALSLDSSFARAAVRFAEAALDGRSLTELDFAASTLARLDSSREADADALLALARVDAALDRLPEAEALARRGLEGGARSPAARLVLAETVLRQQGREKDGAELYFGGLDAADSVAAAAYLKDLAVYLGQARLDSLRALPDSARREAVRRFWEQRAAVAAVSVPERLATHYRRLAVARAWYRRKSPLAVMDASFARMRLPSHDEEFDDRGAIFVRYGHPDRTIATGPLAEFECLSTRGMSVANSDACAGNDSWYYADADGGGPIAFNFARSGTDYYLLGTLGCNAEFLSARLGVDPSAAQYFSACRHDRALQLPMLAATTRSHALTEEKRERGAAPFSADLPFWYDLATLRGAGGRTHVVATIGVPAEKLQPQQMQHSIHYTIHAQVVVTDTLAGSVARGEITRVYETTQPLAKDAVLRFTLDLEAPASPQAVYRVRVEEPATRTGKVYGGPRAVPDYAPGRLGLSDLLLAIPNGGVNWTRDSVQLSLTPAPQFKGGLLTTYYEVYDLPAGTPYDTELEISPAGRGVLGNLELLLRTGRALRLRYTGQATGQPAIPELRQVQAQLPPGRYRMLVRIRALSIGQIVEREREFEVR